MEWYDRGDGTAVMGDAGYGCEMALFLCCPAEGRQLRRGRSDSSPESVNGAVSAQDDPNALPAGAMERMIAAASTRVSSSTNETTCDCTRPLASPPVKAARRIAARTSRSTEAACMAVMVLVKVRFKWRKRKVQNLPRRNFLK